MDASLVAASLHARRPGLAVGSALVLRPARHVLQNLTVLDDELVLAALVLVGDARRVAKGGRHELPGNSHRAGAAVDCALLALRKNPHGGPIRQLARLVLHRRELLVRLELDELRPGPCLDVVVPRWPVRVGSLTASHEPNDSNGHPNSEPPHAPRVSRLTGGRKNSRKGSNLTCLRYFMLYSNTTY